MTDRVRDAARALAHEADLRVEAQAFRDPGHPFSELERLAIAMWAALDVPLRDEPPAPRMDGMEAPHD